MNPSESPKPGPRMLCPVIHGREFPLTPPEELDPLLVAVAADPQPEAGTRFFPRGAWTADGRLDLCKQAIGPEGARRVSGALQGQTTVQSLLLGTNGLGDTGAAAVAELARGHASLHTLYLGCNGIGPDGAGALGEALEQNPRIRALWLKRNPLGDDGARRLAEHLRRCSGLRTLDLVETGIGPAGLAALLDALAGSESRLERLYLGGNDFGSGEAALLRDFLQRRAAALEGLFLSTGRLGDDGATVLAAGLAGTGLRELSLASNGIGPAGAGRLLAVLPQGLESLDLGQSRSAAFAGAPTNAIGDGGAALLAAALEHHAALQELDVSHNGIGVRGLETLIGSALESRALRRLRAAGNALTPPQRQILALLERGGPRRQLHQDSAAIVSVYR